MMSSVMPSLKYSPSGSPLRFANAKKDGLVDRVFVQAVGKGTPRVHVLQPRRVIDDQVDHEQIGAGDVVDQEIAAARELVPYLQRLGLSHIHSPSLLRSSSGDALRSSVVDPTTIDPDLGTEQDLRDLVATLQDRASQPRRE